MVFESVERFVERTVVSAVYPAAMPWAAKGHVERLPSGSFRVSVYAGVDPLTRQEIRLRSTVKGELQAQIELGRLLKEASEGRTPESDATMAGLMDQYAAIAEWDVSTRQTNEGFIRRTIKPALGHLEVRKVRGPILDKLYTRLKRCGDLSCTGSPFTEHRNIPALTINRDDSRTAVPSLACAGPTSVALGWPWSWVSRIAAAALMDASGTSNRTPRTPGRFRRLLSAAPRAGA